MPATHGLPCSAVSRLAVSRLAVARLAVSRLAVFCWALSPPQPAVLFRLVSAPERMGYITTRTMLSPWTHGGATAAVHAAPQREGRPKPARSSRASSASWSSASTSTSRIASSVSGASATLYVARSASWCNRAHQPRRFGLLASGKARKSWRPEGELLSAGRRWRERLALQGTTQRLQLPLGSPRRSARCDESYAYVLSAHDRCRMNARADSALFASAAARPMQMPRAYPRDDVVVAGPGGCDLSARQPTAA